MRLSSIGRRILREPLAQFALVALGLIAFAVLQPGPPRESIVITPSTVEAIVRRHSELLGRTLSEPERRQAIEAHIEEEVLLREALRQGLELSDTEVRREVVRRMRFALEDEVPEPTEADLKRFYEANLERYRTPSSTNSVPASYEEVGAYLREDYLLLERNAAVARKLKELGRDYVVLIEAAPEAER